MLLLALLFFILLGILFPARMSLCTRYMGQGLRNDIVIRVFFMLIPIRLAFQVNVSPAEGFFLFRIKQKNKCVPMKKSKVKDRQEHFVVLLRKIPKVVGVRSFYGEMTIGSTYDAAVLAMVCGSIQSVFETLAHSILPPKSSNKTKLIVTPDFENNWFRLELEGIFHIHTANIIIAVLQRYLSLRGAKSNDASYRKHHEEFYGTN